jgi:hypothetical protein
MHRKYTPVMAQTIPTHTHTLGFLRKNKPITGTKITYSDVINPALPAVVYCIPTCWSEPAIKSATPHIIPAINVFLLNNAVNFGAGLAESAKSGAAAIVTHPPTKKRTAMNVNGPTLSIPAFCATKAVPHMNVATRIIVLLFMFMRFMGQPCLYVCSLEPYEVYHINIFLPRKTN